MTKEKKIAKKPNYSQTREPWKILCSIREFGELVNEGRKHPERRFEITEELNNKFKIPPYLKLILPNIMLFNYDVKNISGACPIEYSEEKGAGCYIYKIHIYPESTKKDLLKMYQLVKKSYRNMGYKTKHKDSLNLEMELFALNLSLENKTHAEINDAIFKKFKITLEPKTVYLYIKRGGDKQNKFRRM